MTLELDHIAICAETLEEGVAYVEQTLGVHMSAGGTHPVMGTHNRVMTLGSGVYLEVIAIDPDAAPPAHARWFALDEFKGSPRIGAWIVRASDFDRAQMVALPGTGNLWSLERGPYAGDILISDTGRMPFDGVGPTMINWKCKGHPATDLPPVGVDFRSLIVRHPKIDEMVAHCGCLFSMPDIRFETAETPSLTLEVDTPHGVRVLR